MATGTAQSVYLLATGWTVQRSKAEWRTDLSGSIGTGPKTHQAFCKIGIGSYSRGQSDWDVLLTTHSVLAPKLNTSRAILYLHLPSLSVGILHDSLYFCLLHVESNNNFYLLSFCADCINGRTVADLASKQIQ